MRILLVSHVFLPQHPSGTEIYTYQVGRALRERGHDVHVFTTEKDISQPNLTVHLREYEGLPVHELYNNLFYNRFEETWDYPPVEASFAQLVDDLAPDVVHFMHLMYQSVGCVEAIARRGIPVIFTLHDYWLQCPRFGQRVHANGSICHTIDFDRCGGCLASFKYRQTRLERGVAKLVAWLNARTGIDLGPASQAAARGIKALSGQGVPPRPREPVPDEAPEVTELSPLARRMAQAVRQRDRELRERLLPVVYRFIAPSRFLRERMLEWGIPERQIMHMRTGIDLASFRGGRREPSQHLRVAFIGTVVPHKGVHVLLEAWSRVPRDLRVRGELAIYGPLTHNPHYIRHLQALAARTGARLAGALRRSEVHEALSAIDLLVVPSVWYENSPLIILEALAAGTPLLVSDLGGMAELVQEGSSGFHFRVGDARHLADQLVRFLRQPELLRELHTDGSPVKDVRHDAVELETLYGEACASVGPPAGAGAR